MADSPKTKEISTFRRLLPQIIASTGKNLLLIDLGLAIAFPTIVIPVLRGLQKERYPDEPIFMSAEAASWYGSVAYIVKPFGSALSGWVAEVIGRKRAMLVVNIPHIISWTMLYYAKSSEEVFVAAFLLGLGIGFMEAPVITYVGEICEPKIRGILVACSGVAVMIGVSLMYLLGTLMDWRTVALASLSLPLITMTVISFLPETPLWLLSKGRTDEALQSLQWLRGWVAAPMVTDEFNEMQRYSENSNSCKKCQKLAIKCLHPMPSFGDRAKELKRKRTLRPFAIVMFCFVIHQFGGVALRPYMVQVVKTFGVPMDSNWTTVVMGVMSLGANIVCMCTVSVIGKRKLFMFSLIGVALSCFALSMYAYLTMPLNWSTFDAHDIDTSVAGPEQYFALAMFFCFSFFSSVGAAPIPWMYLSEVFPFKSRGLATGLTAAINYGVAFVAVKSYLSMENTLHIFGVFLLFGLVSLFGCLVVFFILPETEGFTLEEVEMFFSDSTRKLTDHRISKIPISKTTDEGCDNKAYSIT